ncbi:hypothetical protein [Pantoea sp. B65]|uniref:hypothetical protein n=1 Tax=Pantoea sp. B65 TaxID=2813359 RepID=UPI0039B5D189
MITEEGTSRRLTHGEINISGSLFQNAIDYRRVRVHHGGYFPFGLQNADTAVTPNGEMYWPTKHYKEDFTKSQDDTYKYQWWFIHEMTHVWQYQMGMNVRTRGLISWAVEYKYSLPLDYTLADYPMEQQASIIADYFTLRDFGLNVWLRNKLFNGIAGPDLLNKYKSILIWFLNDPRDRRCLWK